jgi:hypothetical protein
VKKPENGIFSGFFASCELYNQFFFTNPRRVLETLGQDTFVGGRGAQVNNGPIRKFNFGFLVAPYCDQSAISKRFSATQHRHIRTGRTDERT